MDLKQINTLSFEEILNQKLKIKPVKRNQNSLFYISPFRPNEKTASFHITESTPFDLFFDHGSGFGGKIVDFFIHYLNTDARGVLHYFNDSCFSFHQLEGRYSKKPQTVSQDKKYEILKTKEIESLPLIQYLNSRAIPIELARKYCKEIHYKFGERTYYAVGFPTENGFEIRNKYTKRCLNGKGLSWFKNEKSCLRIFESWSDFLSFFVLFPEEEYRTDYLILNSVSLLRKKMDFLNTYLTLQSYFDSDNTGVAASQFLNESFGNRFSDNSKMYSGFKDINELLVSKVGVIINDGFD